MSQRVRFFLGANTPQGFYSLFPQLMGEPKLECSAIKAGPGCGKSTFLRGVADWEEPVRTEEILCSSDPDSLDGVLLHSRCLAVVDGTAPHLCDPALPGVQGDYIAAPAFLDPHGLRRRRSQLEALKGQTAACYTQAYRQLQAAGLVRQRMESMLQPLLPQAQLLRRAAGIAGRELPQSMASGTSGVLRQRFLDGLTPEGPMFLRETVETLAQKVYLLEDRLGLSSFMLTFLRDRALELGLEVYACPDIWDPRRVLHLLIPALSLAFVTEDGTRMPDCEAYRTVRVEAYLPADALRKMRGKLRLLQKLQDSLIEDAVQQLKEARLLHGQMESVYRPHLDIAALDAMQQAFAAARENGVRT